MLACVCCNLKNKVNKLTNTLNYPNTVVPNQDCLEGKQQSEFQAFYCLYQLIPTWLCIRMYVWLLARFSSNLPGCHSFWQTFAFLRKFMHYFLRWMNCLKVFILSENLNSDILSTDFFRIMIMTLRFIFCGNKIGEIILSHENIVWSFLDLFFIWRFSWIRIFTHFCFSWVSYLGLCSSNTLFKYLLQFAPN